LKAECLSDVECRICDMVGSYGGCDWRGGGDEGRAPSFNYTLALENNRIAEKCLTPFVLSTWLLG